MNENSEKLNQKANKTYKCINWTIPNSLKVASLTINCSEIRSNVLPQLAVSTENGGHTSQNIPDWMLDPNLCSGK